MHLDPHIHQVELKQAGVTPKFIGQVRGFHPEVSKVKALKALGEILGMDLRVANYYTKRLPVRFAVVGPEKFLSLVFTYEEAHRFDNALKGYFELFWQPAEDDVLPLGCTTVPPWDLHPDYPHTPQP